MVGRLTLDQVVKVRVLAPQPQKQHEAAPEDARVRDLSGSEFRNFGEVAGCPLGRLGGDLSLWGVRLLLLLA